MRQVSPGVEMTAVICDQVEQETTFGQIEKNEPCDYAKIAYIGGLDYPDKKIVAAILESLTAAAGSWGSYGVLAELPEQSLLFEGFRLAGFSIWARQQIYRLSAEADSGPQKIWRACSMRDLFDLKMLHSQLVPSFSQALAPLEHNYENGLVAYDAQGRCLGFAELCQGPKGIWAQPIISPEADVSFLLSRLAFAISNPTNRPLYLCARSYQPLVALSAEKMGCPKTSAQTLMVKHLVLRERIEQSALKKIFESGSVEGSLPVSQIDTH